MAGWVGRVVYKGVVGSEAEGDIWGVVLGGFEEQFDLNLRMVGALGRLVTRLKQLWD